MVRHIIKPPLTISDPEHNAEIEEPEVQGSGTENEPRRLRGPINRHTHQSQNALMGRLSGGNRRMGGHLGGDSGV